MPYPSVSMEALRAGKNDLLNTCTIVTIHRIINTPVIRAAIKYPSQCTSSLHFAEHAAGFTIITTCYYILIGCSSTPRENIIHEMRLFRKNVQSILSPLSLYYLIKLMRRQFLWHQGVAGGSLASSRPDEALCRPPDHNWWYQNIRAETRPPIGQ